MTQMARQDQANDRFSITSFLYGGNASYIEELQASYEKDPGSVNPEWREFFESLAPEDQKAFVAYISVRYQAVYNAISEPWISFEWMLPSM